MLVLLVLVGCYSVFICLVSDIECDVLVVVVDGQFDLVMCVVRMYWVWNDLCVLDWYVCVVVIILCMYCIIGVEEELGMILECGCLDSSDMLQKFEVVVLKLLLCKVFCWYYSVVYYGLFYVMYDLEKWYECCGDMEGVLCWCLCLVVYLCELYKLQVLCDVISGLVKFGMLVSSVLLLNLVIVVIQCCVECGDVEVQVDFGVLYEVGIGVIESKVDVLCWYVCVGDQGNVYGQYFVGLLQGCGGCGLEKNVDVVVGWFVCVEVQGFYMVVELYWCEVIVLLFFIFE